MKIDDKDKYLEKICYGVGALLILAGLVFFFLTNWNFFLSKETFGRVISAVEIHNENEEIRQLLTVQYYVGKESYEAQWEDDRDKPYDIMEEIKLRYKSSNPTVLLNVEFDGLPISVLILGLVVGFGGFCVGKSIRIKAGTQLNKKNRKKQAELLEYKAMFYESVLPLLIGLFFTIFGIVMAVSGYKIWVWLFIVFGSAYSIYTGVDFVSSGAKWIKTKRLMKYTVHVEDIETK